MEKTCSTKDLEFLEHISDSQPVVSCNYLEKKKHDVLIECESL